MQPQAEPKASLAPCRGAWHDHHDNVPPGPTRVSIASGELPVSAHAWPAACSPINRPPPAVPPFASSQFAICVVAETSTRGPAKLSAGWSLLRPHCKPTEMHPRPGTRSGKRRGSRLGIPQRLDCAPYRARGSWGRASPTWPGRLPASKPSVPPTVVLESAIVLGPYTHDTIRNELRCNSEFK